MNNERSLAKEITEGFEALKSMRNNEPVAWMLVDASWNDFCRYSSYPSEGAIPLYTHPYKPSKSEVNALLDNADYVIGTMREEIEKLKTKTLTDAEIRTIQDMCHLKNVGYNTFIMRFARAILRKAQEK